MGQNRQQGNERPKLKIIIIISSEITAPLPPQSICHTATDTGALSFSKDYLERGGYSKGTGLACSELWLQFGWVCFLVCLIDGLITFLALMITDTSLER